MQRVRLRSSAQTNTGQVRHHNEDFVHLWMRGALVLAIVADGMGGAAGGEEASRLAVETVTRVLFSRKDTAELLVSSGTDKSEELRTAVRAANVKIMEQASARPSYKGMGTTLTMAWVRGTDVTLAHVGDSRAYRVGSTGDIEQLTADHSFVQALVDAGHLTPQQAENHPMSNILYRALGQEADVDVDVYHSGLHVGDRLVLCSDGLTRHVRQEEIAQVVGDHAEPDDAARALIDLANARGGEDNISVIVVLVEAEASVEERAPDLDATAPQPVNAGEDDDTMIIRRNAPTPTGGAGGSSPRSALLGAAAARLRYYRTQAAYTPASLPLNVSGEGYDTRTPDQ